MQPDVDSPPRRSPAGVIAVVLGAAALLVGAILVGSLIFRQGGDTRVAPADLSAGSTPNAVLVYVVDGDTIAARVNGDDVRVRLDGIDTPEKTGGYLAAECYGDEASEYLRNLLPSGTALRLERSEPPTDKYGRLLALVYRAEDGLLINRHLVQLGYADAVNYGGDNPHYAAFAPLASNARARQLGLWGACGGTDTRR